MNRINVLTLWALVAALGCQSKPQDGPSVSGESHFLSACGASGECAAGLECLCGLCTVSCTDNAVCSSAAEAGAVCTDAATCETAGRTCTRACAADADCGAGLACSGGLCVAAPDAALLSLEIGTGWGPGNPGPLLPNYPRVMGGSWLKKGVRAPNTLVLEDSVGVVALSLKPAEFATVEDITRSAAFDTLLAHPEVCLGGTDGDSSLLVRRGGADEVTVPHLYGCAGSGDVVRALNAALGKLELDHMPCPAPPPAGVLPLPQRALCYGCDETCLVAHCPGATVTRGAVDYCIGPDSSYFHCPDDMPIRAAQYGAAVCAAEAPDAETLRSVAREALQSGEIQSLGHIERIELPAEATHWPGIDPGGRVESTVSTGPAGGLTLSAEGAPVPCVETFDHFEVDPAADGFRVSAWNTVWCRDSPGGGAQSTNPAFVSTPPPGRYLFTARNPDGDVAGPTLLVAPNDACPDPLPPYDQCFTGFGFIDCGGDLPPAVFCGQDCRVFAGGCPAAGYTRPGACGTEGVDCSDLRTRNTDMVLSLTVDPGLVTPEAPTVACTCETPPCLGVYEFCSDRATGYHTLRPETNDPEAGLNGLVVLQLNSDPWEGVPGPILWVLEADVMRPEGPRARICLFRPSEADAPGGPPVCAVSGEVVFDREVRTEGDAAAVHGHAVATFENAPGDRPHTVVIDARF